MDVAKYIEWCKDAQERYAYYKHEAESNVMRQEFAAYKRYDERPLWFEMEEKNRGRRSKKETNTKYGFDADGRVRICEETYNWKDEEFTSYSEHQIVTRCYRDGIIDSIRELILDDGAPVYSVEYIVRRGLDQEHWYQTYEYHYEDQRIARITKQFINQSIHYNYPFTCEYDENGELYKVVYNDMHIRYFRLSRQEAVELHQELKQKLVTEVRQAVYQLKTVLPPEEKACFLAIYLHDEPGGLYGPFFHPGLQKVRNERIEQKETKHVFWMSGDHPVNYQESIQNKQVEEQLQSLIVYWSRNNNWWEKGKKLWEEVAMEANRKAWPEDLPITDDFVVYVDREDLDVTRGGLNRCVPEDKRIFLRSRGLL